MSNSRNEESISSSVNNGADRDGVDEIGDSSSNAVEVSGGSLINLTERLTDILLTDRDSVIRWLQALDMRFMGGCRADERLKPLLKMTASSGIVEDHFLAQLSQHFKPAEVGVLARCFYIPLVSIRVGRVDKQGTLLFPTTARGNLNLMVLPSSDFRLSFIGDNGHADRLVTLSSRSSSAAITIDEIPSDNSGRSFVIKSNDRNIYFWCSEKSKLLGSELLLKMQDLLHRRPSIAELTGISKSRLGCFATSLRAYLVESTAVNQNPASSVDSCSSVETTRELSHSHHFGQSCASSKFMRSRNSGSLAVKANSAHLGSLSPHLGSLSPRLKTFKEGLPKTSRDAARDKFRKRADNLANNCSVASSISTDDFLVDSETQTDSSSPLSPSSVLESLENLAAPKLANSSHVSCVVASLFTPHYCWCPSGASSILPQTDELSQLKIPSINMSSLLPFPSMLPVSTSSNLSIPVSPFNLVASLSVEFPALFPEPLVCLPLKTSPQISTFTPLFCDPIVHVPVIDVCSSGQGYLVSAGPTISISIPPSHPKLASPMISATDLEKDARETLRLLLSGSSPGNPQLMNVLPVLTDTEATQSIFLTGSRGLYSNTRDIDAIANSIASFGNATLTEQSTSEHPDDNRDSESTCLDAEERRCG